MTVRGVRTVTHYLMSFQPAKGTESGESAAAVNMAIVAFVFALECMLLQSRLHRQDAIHSSHGSNGQVSSFNVNFSRRGVIPDVENTYTYGFGRYGIPGQ